MVFSFQEIEVDMKSSKRAKENGEQPSIQGSINKSPIGIGGKKSRKNSGGQQQKRAGAGIFYSPYNNFA